MPNSVKPNDPDIEALAKEAYMKDLLQRPPEPAGLTPSQTMIRQGFLPTAGSMVGGGIGAGVGSVFPGVGTGIGATVGSSLGSGAGTLGNFALGLEEPSLKSLGLSMGIPVAMGLGANALRAAGRFFPAGRAAQTLNALGPEEAAQGIASLERPVKSSALFAMASEGGGQVPMTKTLTALSAMKEQLLQSAIGQKTQRPVLKAIEALEQKLATHAKSLSPKELQAELQAVGEQISNLRAHGGPGLGAYKRIFEAMLDDLDNVAIGPGKPVGHGGIGFRTGGTPAAQLLQEARSAFKRESVIREMKDAIELATKSLRGQGAQTQFNANVVLKEIQKNRFFKQAFDATEQKEIVSLFQKLNKIPALSPGAGQQAGSLRALRGPIAGGGLGVLGGMATGTSAGIAGPVGAAAGVILPPAAEFASNLATAISMKTGRALLKQLLTNSDGAITPQVASIIGAFARAATADPESEMLQ